MRRCLQILLGLALGLGLLLLLAVKCATAGPSVCSVDSPDGLYHLVVWSSEGRRSAALLESIGNNPTDGSILLWTEGPWLVQAKWITNNHLQLHFESRGVAPTIPPSWRNIKITITDR